MRRILFSLVIAANLLSCVRQSSGGAASVAEHPAPLQESEAVPIRSTLDIVFLGDSLARGAGDESGAGLAGMVERQLRQRGIAVDQSSTHAVDGARTRGLLVRMADPKMQRDIRGADLIVVSIGANDLFVDSRYRPEVTPDSLAGEVMQRLDSILERIRDLNPRARIFLIGLYNPFFDHEFSSQAAKFVKRWNEALKARYQRQNVTVVPTLDLIDKPQMLGFDRFHPSAAGYRALARRIAEEL